MRRVTILTLSILVLVGYHAKADEKVINRQKAAMQENVKKLKLNNVAIVETNDLLVCAALPEAKAKALAEMTQKAVAIAKENLKIEKDDSLFTGKLAVYALADHADLKTFIRAVEQRRPEQDTYTYVFRGDAHVAVSPDPGVKLADADLTSAAATWAAAAALNKKVGFMADGNMPEWLQIGYGRACLFRSETAAKQSAIRAKVRGLVTSRTKPVNSMELWTGRLVERDLIAGSYVEFLAFGPSSDKFVGFARLTQGSSDIPEAIQSLETTPENLDAAWKTWVLKGK